jgi:hypothetical protein
VSEHIERVDTVLYHGDCVDGFTAAWVAHQRFPDARFIPVHYGEPPPALDPTARVLIVDFSYPRAVLEEMRRAAASLHVLDHHRTAEAELRGLDYCLFDMERSGAGIAWDELMREPRPWLVSYVEDRDLWRHALPQSREVNAYVRSREQSLSWWDHLARGEWTRAADLGEGCLAHIEAYVRAAVGHAYLATMGGETFPIVNVTYESCSEVAAKLCEMYPDRNLAGYYFERGDGILQYGFRSRGDFDVGDFATLFGGGGHKGAAGCTATLRLHVRA